MCGIAGAVDASGAWLDADAVEAMRESMRARGPDDAGFWADGAAMLAFRRLSILDLAGGHQPMATPEGDAVVVFNGEIYNFAALRARLQAAGHRFVTRSDTECILHAYRQWGDDCVGELDGMFAFALWDARARRLLLARDRFGKKPLYYYADGARLAFASTLTALLEHPAVPRALDRDALAEYLALEYVVAPRTILQGVRKLPPATRLTFDAAAGRTTEARYWRLAIDGGAHARGGGGARGGGIDEADATLETLLQAAVRKRLVADVPLGIFLSGGVDSSTVAALAARERAGIETFSIAFADPSFDERSHARAVAAHLGTRHHEEELSLAEAARIVAGLGDVLDEPVADGSIVPTYLLSRFARRHVTVALGGDGADELFAGYPTYVAHRLIEWAGPLASPPVMRAAAALARRLPVSHDNFSFDFRLKKLTAGAAAPVDERNYWWLGACEPARVAALLGDGVARDPFAAVRARYHEPPSGTHLERVLYQDVGLYLTHSVLAKVDRASMAASLEVRAPFLDTAVAEFAGALPLDWKLRRTAGKWILKRVARRLLPPAIVARPKKGFGMPVGRWLRGELEPLARDALLDGGSLAAAGALDRAEIARMLDEHAAGDVDHRQRLWALLVLELWQRKNLKATTSAADRRRASTR